MKLGFKWVKKDREIGFFRRKRWTDGLWRERERRDLMFDMSGPKIEGVLGEFISTPFEERECLYAAHHYTLGTL